MGHAGRWVRGARVRCSRLSFSPRPQHFVSHLFPLGKYAAGTGLPAGAGRGRARAEPGRAAGGRQTRARFSSRSRRAWRPLVAQRSFVAWPARVASRAFARQRGPGAGGVARCRTRDAAAAPGTLAPHHSVRPPAPLCLAGCPWALRRPPGGCSTAALACSAPPSSASTSSSSEPMSSATPSSKLKVSNSTARVPATPGRGPRQISER